jgi:hypothetical protein
MFEISQVLPGIYTIGVPGGNCGRKVVVRGKRMTKTTLVCKT